MIKESFSLTPFPSKYLPKVNITGEIERSQNQLAVRYELCGELESVALPPPLTSPSRKEELWKSTCFEFFLALEDQPGYWEFNMSPSGDWNVYHMEAYRRVGFREETSIQRLPFEVRKDRAGFILEAAVDLTSILSDDQPLEASLTAVIQMKDGSETYWALAHPGSQADFHLRESFILRLAERTHP